jgi:hypothetical protein
VTMRAFALQTSSTVVLRVCLAQCGRRVFIFSFSFLALFVPHSQGTPLLPSSPPPSLPPSLLPSYLTQTNPLHSKMVRRIPVSSAFSSSSPPSSSTTSHAQPPPPPHPSSSSPRRPHAAAATPTAGPAGDGLTLAERKAARAIVAAYSDFWTQVSVCMCVVMGGREGGKEGGRDGTYVQGIEGQTCGCF